jgi:ABC-2 type transport system permease protein
VGLFISTVSRTQQQSFLGGFLFMLPAIMLSGVITPIRAMPDWLRVVTYVNPVRYYVEAVRGVLLKSATFADLVLELGALGVFGTAILGLSAMRFQKRLR